MKQALTVLLAAASLGLLASCTLPVHQDSRSFTRRPDISVSPVPGVTATTIRGADISMLAQVESVGGVYRSQTGTVVDPLVQLADQGVNWVRLRLWHNPVDAQGNWLGGGNNNLARTISLAQRAKDLGLKVLLDFHYSDTWTHPGQQAKPAAWAGLTGTELQTAIHDYTLQVLNAMAAAGALPDMVQIGNEIDTGFLLDSDATTDNDGSISHPASLAALLNKAALAVRTAATANSSAIPIMIHLARGGRVAMYQSFFDMFAAHDTDGNGTWNAGSAIPATVAAVDFDIIGLSWYPWWHSRAADSQAGGLPTSDPAYTSRSALDANIANLTGRYGKEIIIAEASYAWTLDWADNSANAFGASADVATGGYPATVQGQADFIRDTFAAVMASNLGRGAFYWAPEWIPASGAGWKAGEGNNWENQALFDFDGVALPSMSVFSRMLP